MVSWSQTSTGSGCLNCRCLSLSLVFEKGEESLPCLSLHLQRLAPLKSSRLLPLLLLLPLPLLLPLQHLLVDHQAHVLLQHNPRPSYQKKKMVVLTALRPTCQASNSWDSATLCLMVLSSCCVRDSFS